VTVSVGLAEIMPEETADDLVRRADAGLYAAKKAGRDCTFYHNGTNCEPIAVLERANLEQRPVEEPAPC
jgi:predicted signal transduction protein with EAL and GGDEF domain